MESTVSTREQQPTYLTNPPTALTSEQWLAKAQELTRGASFSKEDSAKFEAYMALHTASRQSWFDREAYNTARQRRDFAMNFDPATLQFFSRPETARGSDRAKADQYSRRAPIRMAGTDRLQNFAPTSALNDRHVGRCSWLHHPYRVRGRSAAAHEAARSIAGGIALDLHPGRRDLKFPSRRRHGHQHRCGHAGRAGADHTGPESKLSAIFNSLRPRRG